MSVLRKEAQKAADAARSSRYALGPVLLAMRVHVDADLRKEAEALAQRCAAGFGFGAQAAGALMKLATQSRRLQFVDGEFIVREGERSDTGYVILDGHVRIARNDGTVLAVLQAGDTFGEVELLRHRPRMANAIVEGGASALRLDPGLLTSVRQSHREVRALLDALYRERALSLLGCDQGWFGGVQGEQRRSLLAHFEERKFTAGDRILRAGTHAAGFFVILGGAAAVQRDDQEIARLGPGAFFGEISILQPATHLRSIHPDRPGPGWPVAGEAKPRPGSGGRR